jgi:hypothetical protein
VERALKQLGAAQRDAVAALESRLEDVAERAAQQASQKDALETLHALRALTRSLKKDHEAKLYKALDAIAAGTGPIVVGPWTGEVGFEILYWIPFVHWFQSRWSVDPRRLTIVSRGGVASWYGLDGAGYVDIFSLFTPEVYRARTDPVEHKQRSILPFDREIARGATERVGIDPASPLLHPELMYRTFAPFWRDDEGIALVDRFTMHRRLHPVRHAAAAGLPRDYVAVRFYFSDAFPDTAVNHEFLGGLVRRLAQTTPVVVLDPGFRVDDHADYAADALPNVTLLPAGIPPAENLAIQSAILGGARGFIGTYGGYSYLAPFYGVPSVALYSHRTFKLHHLFLAQRTFERFGTAGLTAISTEEAALVRAAVQGATR